MTLLKHFAVISVIFHYVPNLKYQHIIPEEYTRLDIIQNIILYFLSHNSIKTCILQKQQPFYGHYAGTVSLHS